MPALNRYATDTESVSDGRVFVVVRRISAQPEDSPERHVDISSGVRSMDACTRPVER